MLELSDNVEPVHPAATIVLVRDGNRGLETLLVQRNAALKHMGGMWVFPGGRVESGDYPADGDTFKAAVNAAVRETGEEAGLQIDAGQLVYLSHWTAPEGAKKRFATWFFLAILDADQEVTVDGGEIASYRWVAPARALEEAQDPTAPLRLLPPTFVSLVELTEFDSCADARRVIEQRQTVSFTPRMVFIEDGICFLYAEDAGYGSGDPMVEGPRHRMYMVNEQLEYVREL